MRVYLSGPMTGKARYNVEAFNAAAKRLRKQGHFVINPHRISNLFGSVEELAESFADFYFVEDQNRLNRFYQASREMERRIILARAVMDADLAAVHSCDAIYLLKGWETSRGAKKELAEAIRHGLMVMQEGNEV